MNKDVKPNLVSLSHDLNGCWLNELELTSANGKSESMKNQESCAFFGPWLIKNQLYIGFGVVVASFHQHFHNWVDLYYILKNIVYNLRCFFVGIIRWELLGHLHDLSWNVEAAFQDVYSSDQCLLYQGTVGEKQVLLRLHRSNALHHSIGLLILLLEQVTCLGPREHF